MAVVLDEQERLFQPGEAPDAALYCGWYSLGKYVDAFTWAKGAVGFHAASSECTTLRNRTSTVWCKSMLEKGVAATLGPVAEPYLQSFPLPDVFFGCLTDGRLTLAECYAVSNPFLVMADGVDRGSALPALRLSSYRRKIDRWPRMAQPYFLYVGRCKHDR